MAAGGSNLVDQELADFHRKFRQLILRETPQIAGSADLFKHFRILPTIAGSIRGDRVDVGHTVAVDIGGLQFEHRTIVAVANP